MLVIITNTFVLAMDDPTSNTDSRLTKETDDLFLGIYTAEACLKIVGLGFYFSKKAYIKDNWNKMDFVIVVTAWMSVIFSQGIDLRALRTIRVLRPLRSISNVKGLRQLFLALIYSLKMLVSSVIVLIFFFFIFAIAGLQLYMGILRNRCMDMTTGLVLDDSEICGARECGIGLECVLGLNNPNSGVTNFDNILFAFLAVFQCVTLEGWTNIMNSLQKSLSFAVVLYFVPLVFIGAFFLLNLTLAVIKNSFTKVMDSSRDNGEELVDIDEIEQKIEQELSSGNVESIDPMKLDTQRSEESEDSLKPDESLLAQVGHVRPELKKQASIAAMVYPLKLEESDLQVPQSLIPSSRGSSSQEIGRSILMSNFSIDSMSSARGQNSYLLEADMIPSRNSFVMSPITTTRRNSGQVMPSDLAITLKPIISIQVEPSSAIKILHEESMYIDNSRGMSLKTISPELRTFKTFKTSSPEFNTFKTFFKTMTYASQADTSQVSFKRFRNAIRMDKTLIKRITEEQSEDINVKCIITETAMINSSSVCDVAPIVSKSNAPKAVLFRYESAILEAVEAEGNALANVNKFRLDSLRLNQAEAYLAQTSLAKDIIDKSAFHGAVVGYWSGGSVSEAIEIDENKLRSYSEQSYTLWSKGVRGKIERALKPLYFLVTANWFNNTMTICVILNTMVLAMDHYGISQAMSDALTNLNLTFTVIFGMELVLKLMGLGVKLYFKDSMNYFDFFVVILSLIELFLLSGNSALSAFRTIRIFRTFRVLRVARIFRYLQSMSMILRVIGRTISQFIYLAMLLLLFTLIFALIGMQIFGGTFDFEEGKPRANFDSFLEAYLSVFQLMTVEGWNLIMYDGIRAVGPGAAIYFVSWVFLGNFVLLNLFLAILLDSFNQEVNDDTNDMNSTIDTSSAGSSAQKKLRRRKEEALRLINDENENDNLSASSELLRQDSGKSKPMFFNIFCVKSYLIFKKTNPFRILCFRVTSSHRFEWFILTAIILNAIKLVWDTYLIEEPIGSVQLEVSNYLDLAFTIIFGLEFIMKSVSMGFINERGSYLSESWNKLDFLIVVISIVELSFSGVSLSSLKVLRLLRTLRPLRFISHNSSMKLVVTALLESVAAIMNVTIVVLIVWLIFAILGMSLFSGKLHYCTNNELKTKTDCEDFGHSWLPYDSNFDNTYEAIKTLFILSSLENWPVLMYRAMDTTDVDRALETNSNPAAALYFLVFVLLGSYFFMNLFIGVVFEKFQLAKKSESSLSMLFMKKDQIFWVEMQELAVSSKPQIEVVYKPKDKFRKFFYKLAISTGFEMTIMVCIVLNMLQMAIGYYEASQAYTNALEYINLCFTAIFIIEATIKLLGYGFLGYFRQGWNQFDFFVVTTSIIDLSMTYFGSSTIKFLRVGPQLARVIRVLRVSKLFRIVKSLKSIQNLLRILGYSLPAVFNILSLLLLIYFIYAILGVYLFNSVKSGNIIDEYNNFNNFGMAIITLLRASTGEDWPTIMYDCMVTEHATTTIYFLSFTLITNFIMLNMFIMVILQQWEILANNPQNVVHIFNKDCNYFKAVWMKHSCNYKGIKTEFNTLNQIMFDLGPDLGASLNEDQSKVQKLVYSLRLPMKDGCIFYNDLLFALLKRKHRPKIDRATEKLRYILMEREEHSTLKKLARLRERQSAKLNSENRVSRIQVSFITKDNNMFFTMLNVRKVFNSWRTYTVGRKDGLYKDTSVENSLADFRVRNTPEEGRKPYLTVKKLKVKTMLSRSSTIKTKVTTNPYSLEDLDSDSNKQTALI